jgi:DNA gyrase subunit A
MKLSKGTHIVAMSILPAGIAPEASSSDDEEEEEEAPAAAAAAGAAAPGSSSPAAAAEEDAGPCLLLVTQQGLGKRTPISDFRVHSSRTGKGVKALRLNPGDRLATVQVVGVAAPGSTASSGGGGEGEEAGSADVLVSTQQGLLVRVPISDIRISSRQAKGFRLVRVQEGDEVVAATVLSK